MSLEYFFSLKKNYENIYLNLEEIRNTYIKILEDSIIENGDNQYSQVSRGEITNIQFCISEYEEKMKQIETSKQNINNKLKEICQHEFVRDYIDVSPERSIEITYCSICEYTQK